MFIHAPEGVPAGRVHLSNSGAPMDVAEIIAGGTVHHHAYFSYIAYSRRGRADGVHGGIAAGPVG